jgi:hypothetical protein
MMHFETLIRALFPYRSHLESEVEYLKSQLAAQTRRADVLTEQLLTLKLDAVTAPKLPRKDVKPLDLAEIQGHGWQAYQDRKAAIQLKHDKELTNGKS